MFISLRMLVIPAEAGIQMCEDMDSALNAE